VFALQKGASEGVFALQKSAFVCGVRAPAPRPACGKEGVVALEKGVFASEGSVELAGGQDCSTERRGGRLHLALTLGQALDRRLHLGRLDLLPDGRVLGR